MMFKVRVIPCLDVKDGRVVKGVNFVDLRDAGDPVEAAIAYDAAGADELSFLDITASHENRDTIFDVVHAHRRSLLHAAHRRRRRAHASRTSASCSPAAPTRSRSTPRRSTRPRLRQGGGGEIRRPVHRGRDRRQEGVAAGRADRWEIFTHGGRKPTGLDAVDYAREVVALGAGEILLTSMDRDGTRHGYDIALTRAIADAVAVPVIASGGVGTLDHWSKASATATPPRCWPPRSSTSANIRCAQAKALHGESRAADAARSVIPSARRRGEGAKDRS